MDEYSKDSIREFEEELNEAIRKNQWKLILTEKGTHRIYSLLENVVSEVEWSEFLEEMIKAANALPRLEAYDAFNEIFGGVNLVASVRVPADRTLLGVPVYISLEIAKSFEYFRLDYPDAHEWTCAECGGWD